MFKVPEKFRVKDGMMASDKSYGNNGLFSIKTLKLKYRITAIASDGLFWEHVSVSMQTRCPTWEEMATVKGMFWDGDDLVIQFHPPKSEYVDNHRYCLHLWRKAGTNDFCDVPDSLLVGLKSHG